MKVTREKTENSQAFLTIEMEPAEVEESLDKSYQRLVKKTNIPGFRKGKVPREILERYLGKESLFEDAINHLIPQAYEKAIKEQEIDPIAQAQVEVAQTDPVVVFKATVPLPPTVELGDYHQIQVAPSPVEFADGDVDAAIERLRHQRAAWEPVERPVAFDDLVVLDIDSTIDDKPFIKQKGVQYQVLRDLTFPAPGFPEQLLNMKRDEEKEFKLQFSTDNPKSELAGKESAFKVKVTEVKQEILSELDDEFAKGISPDFPTLASLRERVSADLKLGAEERARRDFEERAIDAVVALAQVAFPPVLVEVEIDRLIREQMRQWQMDSRGLEKYLKSVNKTPEELREELRPLATKRTTRSIVLGKIAEEEKIEVSDAEINAEVERMVSGAGEKKEELQKFFDSPQSRESVKQLLMARKTVEKLVEIAKSSEGTKT